ncbi:ADR256Wp [Eremothecium gossypii ATCC 10895]|uniref:ADR256Wp n=1 Tax=Eremothecium gossypii (strain ATCC 10895 / CBS 109.51 / FGSC 9923 / NRRL Y-1056) TaxID=284811 RepID=Q759M0_EREGS|nr:60S acidic ribosomal protein P1 [Eremothecium gossypii ATCC 10895]AAS52176.2 ADR256Wp [Eremothecium gossypii ATCC 10895]AEY96475.1 FADR256Wp [Eremothecium gossypii FDAG1]
MSVETALSYAALILADAEVEISSENLLTLTRNANVEVEGIWADIYAKALESQNLKDLLVKFEGGAAAAPAAGAAAAGGAAAEEEAEPEEAKEESDDDMGFGLFD